MVVALALPPLLGRELSALIDLLRGALRAAEDPTVPVALAILREGLLHTFFALLLLGAAAMVMGVGAALAQGGFFLATKSAKPTFAKLNPIKGAKRLFGTQALWEGGKMLIKSSPVAILVYCTIQSKMPMPGWSLPTEHRPRNSRIQ